MHSIQETVFDVEKIQITDRSGNTAVIDLSATQTVDDVLKAINDSSTISVTASTDGDGLVLTDTTGSTSNNLTVIDLNGGSTASELGTGNRLLPRP